MTATHEGTRLDLRLPSPTSFFAPVTRRRLGRTVTAYAVLWAIGLTLALTGGDSLAALGLGLAVPGGGLLAGGHPIWGAIAVLGFVLSVLIWWSMGPTVLPPIVWVGLAVLGASAVDWVSGLGSGAVLAAGPLAIVTAFGVHLVRHRAQRATGRALNQRLASLDVVVAGPPALHTDYPVAESTDEDLSRLRYGLDLALQPLDDFEGFTHIDQFREGALRYQLNALSYGLSMSQFTRTPAFTGYLAEAQRNAITKMLHRKSWGYWAIENAWGNCRLDKDPVDNRDNVMLTGFYGLMIGMYESLNDDRFSRAGALDFRWDETTSYPYSFGDLAASIHRNILRSDFSLFACEPNWIYTICNTFGLNTMLTHDRLHGTAYAAEALPRLREAYDTEFLRPDGRIIGVRSSHLGLSWNFWSSPAVQTTTSFWMHPGLPEVAHRTWWLLRESAVKIEDGKLVLPQTMSVRLDPGNYKIGRDTFAQAVSVMAGREMGDEEYARAAERTLVEREPVAEQDGVSRLADASGLTNLYLALGRFGRHNGLRDLVRSGVPDAWRDGPKLTSAAYPDVLVAHAVSDGHAIDLVLMPGAGPVRTQLHLGDLVPGRTYAVDGASVASLVADGRGDAVLEVDLDRRLRLRVH